jgi:catechol 2,3-dioxygenase-like lactoylglutathione lyase family enzyme
MKRSIYLLILFLSAPALASAPLVTAVEEVAVTVSDADRSLAFYRDVLGCVVDRDGEVASTEYERLEGVFGARLRVVKMHLGEEKLALLEWVAPRGRPIPADQRSQDGGFQHLAVVVSDMEAGYRWLREHKVRSVSTGPQTLPAWNVPAAGIKAFYFSDPDDHTLEIIWFPPGKGDPRWQRRTALFQGIDHTAIGVADTEASLRLYGDRLGLRPVGHSENYGTEQEHLNNVFGARLRITTLRAAHGPGIELLQYLSPRDGRPVPADLRANDLLHWQTRLRVRDVAGALNGAAQAQARQVSPGVVTLGEGPFGKGPAALVRDPDGHALLLVQ